MTEPIPREFLDRMRLILSGDALDAAIMPRAEPAVTAIRLNPLRGDPEATLAHLSARGIAFTRVPWCPEAVLAHTSVRELQQLPSSSDGDFHIQSLSSMAVTLALDPKPGESVLDLCAAPGSKTSHIAAMMSNRGRLVAVEASRPRAFRLKEVLRTLGAHAEIHVARGERWARANRGGFDRVLLDAPCSAEGRILAGDKAAAADWSIAKIRRLASSQKSLLHAGIEALREGGTLVYSTCTLAPEENELVLERALERYGDAIDIVDTHLASSLGVRALASWMGRELPASIQHARRLVPPLEGFFIARLSRRYGASIKTSTT